MRNAGRHVAQESGASARSFDASECTWASASRAAQLGSSSMWQQLFFSQCDLVQPACSVDEPAHMPDIQKQKIGSRISMSAQQRSAITLNGHTDAPCTTLNAELPLAYTISRMRTTLDQLSRWPDSESSEDDQDKLPGWQSFK